MDDKLILIINLLRDHRGAKAWRLPVNLFVGSIPTRGVDVFSVLNNTYYRVCSNKNNIVAQSSSTKVALSSLSINV